MAQKFDVKRDQVVDRLLKNDFEFRQLYQEHQTLETRLREIDARRYLTVREEMERKQIQKQKLQGKDRMEEILRVHSIQRSVSLVQ